MNKYIKYLGLAAVPFLFTGCKDDMPQEPLGPQGPDYVTIHFGVMLDDLDGTPDTRSLAPGYQFSDGKSISDLKCYVYNQANGINAAPAEVVDVDIKTVNSQLGGDVTVMLPKGNKYDFVFLGTSIPQTAAPSKLYYNPNDRTLSVDYSTITCNDEEMDCFFASQTGVTTETAFDANIVLKRPFAQLNIGTNDYDIYDSTTPIKDISVTVDGIYNKINLMDGSLIGNTMKVTINGASRPTGQTFPVAGYEYLSMNYLLVNTRKLVDMSFSVNHVNSGTPSKVVKIGEVAVERNYQTNVYGKALLTEEIPSF